MKVWKSVAEAFVPGRSLLFIEEFFETLKQYSDKDRATVRRVRLLYALVVAQCIAAFVILVTPGKTRYYQLITFNLLVLHGFPVATDIEIFLAALFFLNLIYIIFNQSYYNYSIRIMYNILMGKDKSFMFNSKKQINGIILKFFNIFQLMSIVLDAFIIINYFKFLSILLAEYQVSGSLLGLLCYHIFFILFNAGITMSLYFGGFYDIMGMATWMAFRIRVMHLRRILDFPITKFTILRLQCFRREQYKTFKFIHYLNKLYSIILTTLLLSSGPLSATLFTALLTQTFSLHLTIVLTMFIAFIFIATLFLHISAAKFSTYLHSPYHRVMSLNIRLLRCSLRSRLQLAWNIQAFHVHKRYGLMYAYFGLITMLAFAKVIFVKFFFLNFSHKYF